MSTPDEETKQALREFLDEVDRAIERLATEGAVEASLWRVMVAAGANWCEHCGDMTEPDEDPSPTLCAMCAKAGRT